MSDAVVAYVPVLHEGYRRFLQAHAAGRPLYLIGPELYADYRPLAKDIRALEPAVVAPALAAWGIASTVTVLDAAGATRLAEGSPSLTLPDEDVSHQVVERFFPRCAVHYDTVFLRWDKTKTVQLLPVGAARAAPAAEVLTDLAGAASSASLSALIAAAEADAAQSVDWWRQVGAALRLADGTLLAGHNEHAPHPWAPYVVGDPRSSFFQGVHLDLSTATHAEAGLIAAAARAGTATAGATMYVTDFPCPPCAKLIAGAGIARLYYRAGYAVLDGRDVLGAAGVEVVHVVTP